MLDRRCACGRLMIATIEYGTERPIWWCTDCCTALAREPARVLPFKRRAS